MIEFGKKQSMPSKHPDEPDLIVYPVEGLR
jgi:hypothetical protein